MRVKIIRKPTIYLEETINQIGYENILNIIPEYHQERKYVMYLIIYKVG